MYLSSSAEREENSHQQSCRRGEAEQRTEQVERKLEAQNMRSKKKVTQQKHFLVVKRNLYARNEERNGGEK